MAEFKEEYFVGEYREGFFVERKMKHAWAAQIEVLEVLDQICRKHKIQYFADWGTLLGAVRHQGFIPWDDDIDIAMKREDYQRFLSVFSQEKPKEYCLKSIYTEEEWSHSLSRITNGREIRFDEKHLKRYHGCPYIVGIDIFPLDYIPRNNEAEVQLGIVKAIMDLLLVIELQKQEVRKREDKEQEDAITEIEKICGISINRKGNIENQLLRLLNKVSALYGEEESEELTFMADGCINKNSKFRKEWYGESILVPFENIMIPIPRGYDEILKVMYGDYMTPIQNKQSHEYPFYKEQDAYIQEYMQKKEAVEKETIENVLKMLS